MKRPVVVLSLLGIVLILFFTLPRLLATEKERIDWALSGAVYSFNNANLSGCIELPATARRRSASASSS